MNLKKILFFVALLPILLACNNNDTENKTVETPEIQFQKEGELYFLNAEKDTLKTIEIEIAETSYENQTGLMYRKSMKENRGMLFVYSDNRPRPYFYMKNTYIALDLVYINNQYTIVDFNENTEPLNEDNLPSDAPAQYVLEINAGKVAAWDLKLGDSVVIERD